MVKEKFAYAELDAQAQERAREWYRTLTIEDWEPNTDDLARLLGMLGITVDVERYAQGGGKYHNRLAFGWAIGYTQGDYANFNGDWEADRMDLAALQTECPTDERLLDIGARLMGVVLKWPRSRCAITASAPAITASAPADITRGVADPELEEYDPAHAELEGEVESIIKDLFRWLYDYMRSDLDWVSSDEVVVEGIEANGYEFDEYGDVL